MRWQSSSNHCSETVLFVILWTQREGQELAFRISRPLQTLSPTSLLWSAGHLDRPVSLKIRGGHVLVPHTELALVHKSQHCFRKQHYSSYSWLWWVSAAPQHSQRSRKRKDIAADTPWLQQCWRVQQGNPKEKGNWIAANANMPSVLMIFKHHLLPAQEQPRGGSGGNLSTWKNPWEGIFLFLKCALLNFLFFKCALTEVVWTMAELGCAGSTGAADRSFPCSPLPETQRALLGRG